MQRLIIITGDLATGKSTLASALSDELRIPFITKDRLKEIACDILVFIIVKKIACCRSGG